MSRCTIYIFFFYVCTIYIFFAATAGLFAKCLSFVRERQSASRVFSVHLLQWTAAGFALSVFKVKTWLFADSL